MHNHGILALTDFYLISSSRLYKIESQPRPHQAEPSFRPGLIEPTLHINVNQVSLSKLSTSTSTRPHRAEPLGQVSSGRASAPTSTRLYQAEPPRRRQPGFLGQSLHTNFNQASLGRVPIPTLSRPHRAEPPLTHACQASLSREGPGLWRVFFLFRKDLDSGWAYATILLTPLLALWECWDLHLKEKKHRCCWFGKQWPTYAAKLGLVTWETNIGAQKIDDAALVTVIAGFLLQDKLKGSLELLEVQSYRVCISHHWWR